MDPAHSGDFKMDMESYRRAEEVKLQRVVLPGKSSDLNSLNEMKLVEPEESVEIKVEPVVYSEESEEGCGAEAAVDGGGEKREDGYKCTVGYCGEIFETLASVQQHLLQHKRELPTARVGNSPNPQERGNGLKKKSHLGLHSKGKPLECNYSGCGNSFEDEESLAVHISTHLRARMHTCAYDGCGRKFPDKESLKDHIQNHIRDIPAMVKQPLKPSVRRVRRDKNYVCTVQGCGQRFRRRQCLEEHAPAHEVGERFECEYEGCGRRFKERSQLRVHSMVHEPMKVGCIFANCFRLFTRKEDLDEHVVSVHSGTAGPARN